MQEYRQGAVVSSSPDCSDIDAKLVIRMRGVMQNASDMEVALNATEEYSDFAIKVYMDSDQHSVPIGRYISKHNRESTVISYKVEHILS